MNPPDAVPGSILRHRPFVFYWSARTCAAMGFQMLGVAVAWQMYALTGSAFDLGLVGLTQFLPAAAERGTGDGGEPSARSRSRPC